MSTYIQGDIIKVNWVDTVSHSGWGEFNDEGMDCKSVGFFYKETREYLAIYQSHLFGLDGVIANRADYLQIPKVAIKKTFILVEADE